MKRYIAQHWKSIAKPELYYHDEGYYIVKFQTEANIKEILYSRPYSINNKPVILKQSMPYLDFNSEFLTKIPLIGRAMGIPFFVDECTMKQTRISYARMLVEVDITKVLPTEIKIMDTKGNIFQQPIYFDWKAEYCDRCIMVGHGCLPAKQT
ncbi:hypothetical protein P3S67_001168 [Capsicum chacoense]